ncbi:MAG TPA: glycine cleavage system aminomethyltransferase GcvT [Thermodesulfobacteriota bacterium]|nr:glycine cleavage system aminomethyltransferase GcvT [Thermodesulfobacteriota bacterium]
MRSETPLKRTALAETHRRLGARMGPFAGWEMPLYYRGVLEEHEAVRSRAGLFDVSHMGQLVVAGPGALALVQRVTTNDAAALAVGQVQYSAMCREDGGTLDDLTVYRLEAERYLLCVNAANVEKDFAWLRAQAAGVADVSVADESLRWSLLALQGPRAEAILARLTPLELAGLGYYRSVQGEVDGLPAIVSRTGYTGEDGFELYVPWESGPRLFARLLEVGAADGLVPAGLGARDTLRLEMCYALYGHELDEATTPLEAGLGWIVKLDKGAFVGREALVRQKAQGVRKRLVGFEVEGAGICRSGHTLHRPGEAAAVGVVTSGTMSPTLRRPIGLGYVPPELAAVGTRLEADVRGRRVSVRVVKTPFVPSRTKKAA